MWTTNWEFLGDRIQFGLGVMGITSLQSNQEQSNYLSGPSTLGVYSKLEYPILKLNPARINLLYENSIFAPVFLRNSLGLSFVWYK